MFSNENIDILQNVLADAAWRLRTTRDTTAISASTERIKAELARELEECEDCGHAIAKHGPDGCTHERGDAWVDGVSMGAWVARGPCGCSAWAIRLSESA